MSPRFAQASFHLTGGPTAIDYQKLVTLEHGGESTFKEVVEDKIITIDVRELLNGVDAKSLCKDKVGGMVRIRTVFFSYSHKDEELRDELETHLKLLRRQRVISNWLTCPR